MKTMIIEYTVKPHLAAENQGFIERVFEELRANSTADVRYSVFKASDGVSFKHLVSLDTDAAENPLVLLPAFQAFQAGIQDRCVEQPRVTVLEAVGSYMAFGA